MYYRCISEDLRAWAQKPSRKPLILRGARQVGKTTEVKTFGQQYTTFLYLNLEIKAHRDLFERDYSINELIAAIHFYLNKKIEQQGLTLLFIDEIQVSPKAAAMLRYFYEERNDIHVIAAGSLLETLMGKHISFPVGRVEYLFMYPMSFSEYLLALGETEAHSALEQLPCPSFAHEKLLHCFHEYTLVGGMPEAVSVFAKNKDLVATNAVYQALLLSFMEDVEKYAPNRSLATIIRHAIEHAPLESGNRIHFEGFGHSHYKSREMGEALRILEKTMLITLNYPTTKTVAPCEINYKKYPKLQFIDTGLVNYAASLQSHYFKLTDLHSIFMGRIVESVVAQELLASNKMLRQKIPFWVREKSQANAEVDFVFPFQQYAIPVEVKAGKTGALKSLMQYMELTDHAYAIRLYAGKIQTDTLKTPSGKSFQLLNLPYYLTSRIEKYLLDAIQGL